MRNKKEPTAPKRMQDRGWKALTTFVKIATYHALEEYCFREKTKHAALLRELLERELEAKGYLRKSKE